MERIPTSEPLQGLSQLPEDVLWAILGFVDLPTLYTARLVCKRFCKSAAGHFKALSLDCATLAERPPTDFRHFSGTAYFAVSVTHASHLRSLVHPGIAPVITHVSLTGFHLRDSRFVEELEAVLMRLPKLRSLTVQPRGRRRGRGRGGGRSLQGGGVPWGGSVDPPWDVPQRVERGEGLGRIAQPAGGEGVTWHRAGGVAHKRVKTHNAEICGGQGQGPENPAPRLAREVLLPLFPPWLEELKITHPHRKYYVRWAGVGDASPLTRCSALTCLELELRTGAETSIASLSSLRGLRSLALRGCPSAVGALSTFTALTSLTFEEKSSKEQGSTFPDLARLTGLSRLALPRILTPKFLWHEELRCIAQLTNLTCLDVSGCTLDDWAGWESPLQHLTRLVSVRFPHAAREPGLPGQQITALQSLTLSNVGGAIPLRWATSLTHLNVSTTSCKPTCLLSTMQESFPLAVAGMTRLRSLEISFGHAPREDLNLCDPYCPMFPLDVVLGACTMLTKLVYRGWNSHMERDVKACASLPNLRSLSFVCIRRLTPAYLPALQAMSGLTELSLLHTRIRVDDMTPDIIAAFDAKRRQMGWPLLKLRVETRRGEHRERLER